LNNDQKKKLIQDRQDTKALIR